jgi:hypothetical protein
VGRVGCRCPIDFPFVLWQSFGMTTKRKSPSPLEAARIKSGLSYGKVHLAVYDRLGEYAPTPPTIAAYHADQLPRHFDVVLLAAIADVYGMTAKEARPDLIDYIDLSREVLLAASG